MWFHALLGLRPLTRHLVVSWFLGFFMWFYIVIEQFSLLNFAFPVWLLYVKGQQAICSASHLLFLKEKLKEEKQEMADSLGHVFQVIGHLSFLLKMLYFETPIFCFWYFFNFIMKNNCKQRKIHILKLTRPQDCTTLCTFIQLE